MVSFIRRVATASGARAVQVVHEHGRAVVGIENIASAHDEAGLVALMQIAGERLRPGQGGLDLGSVGASGPGSGARLVGMWSRVLWDVLVDAYGRLGFDAVRDETFAELVLARSIEPTSTADTIRVLAEIAGPGAVVAHDLHLPGPLPGA